MSNLPTSAPSRTTEPDLGLAPESGTRPDGETSPAPLPPATPRLPRDSALPELITAARMAPAGLRGVLACGAATALLGWAAFPPLDFGPLGWLCLVPLLLLTRPVRPMRRLYPTLYLAGLLFWVPTLQWMRLGDATMYVAWIVASSILALLFPLFVGLTRSAVHRYRVPLAVAAPVVWTGLELLRNHFPTAFGWYYLGHTQYRWTELIQICDLTGVYGVSCLMVGFAAVAAELVPVAWIRRLGLLPAVSAESLVAGSLLSNRDRWLRVAVCCGLLGGVLAYGVVRRSQADFQSGLKVALVQGNVATSVHNDPREAPRHHQQHLQLTGQAVREQPDLIVWPETMFQWPYLSTPANVSDEQLALAHPEVQVAQLRRLEVAKTLESLSGMAGAGLLVGISTVDLNLDRMRVYNSAVFVRPDTGVDGRYDKLHRVIFGEYIPFADWLPFLQSFTPYRGEFGIAAGDGPRAFDYKGSRFAPIICYEDTVPDLVRRVVRETSQIPAAGATAPRKLDFLVNLTNDGWFHGSSELDQHLITASFRCVECRVPMVRSVNTGISAVIDGDGVIRKRAVDLQTGRSKQVAAVVVDHVPLDHRGSLYLYTGDWFAGLCLAFVGLLAGANLAAMIGPARWRMAAARVG